MVQSIIILLVSFLKLFDNNKTFSENWKCALVMVNKKQHKPRDTVQNSKKKINNKKFQMQTNMQSRKITTSSKSDLFSSLIWRFGRFCRWHYFSVQIKVSKLFAVVASI